MCSVEALSRSWPTLYQPDKWDWERLWEEDQAERESLEGLSEPILHLRLGFYARQVERLNALVEEFKQHQGLLVRVWILEHQNLIVQPEILADDEVDSETRGLLFAEANSEWLASLYSSAEWVRARSYVEQYWGAYQLMRFKLSALEAFLYDQVMVGGGQRERASRIDVGYARLLGTDLTTRRTDRQERFRHLHDILIREVPDTMQQMWDLLSQKTASQPKSVRDTTNRAIKDAGLTPPENLHEWRTLLIDFWQQVAG